MSYAPVTSFRRAVDAVHLDALQVREMPLPDCAVNKWEALRELAAARKAFGLSNRDLGVLQALLSFHRKDDLDDDTPIVWPSNATICDRLNGMPCSTMRRHLAALVRAGVILRRDSPNGKRYRQRVAGGQTFGFDLSPLARRYAEFRAEADRLRAEAQAAQRLRETLSLMRRDLLGLLDYGHARFDPAFWSEAKTLGDEAARLMRRQLSLRDLQDLHDRLSTCLTEIRSNLEIAETEKMSTSSSQNEQHYQSSQIDTFDSEQAEKPCEAAPDNAPSVSPPRDADLLPLGVVLEACPEVRTFTPEPIRHWHDLTSSADKLCAMMGISASAWDSAKATMGSATAAVVVSAILQRFSDIRSPGGYLRDLTAKSAAGAFSPKPMIHALLRKTACGSQL